MVIGIDIFEAAVYPFRGLGRYASRLCRSLLQQNGENRYQFLSTSRAKARDLSQDLGPVGDYTIRELPLSLRQRRILWLLSNKFHLPLNWAVGKVDLFHATDFIGPWLHRTPLIITIHDLALWHYPQTSARGNRFYLRQGLPISALRANRVIVDSESTRRDVLRFLPISEEKVRVVHLAADPAFQPISAPAIFGQLKRRLRLNSSYILSVGTIEPRKNYPFLFESFHTLLQRPNPLYKDLKLVVVGKLGWLYEDTMRSVDELRLSSKVIFVDSLTDEELCQLYAHCQIFAYPSLYEGFGLPALEAMACGAPVIASNISSLTEVVGTAGILINPNENRELINALTALLEDDAQREEWRQKSLEQAKRFSWEKTATETAEVYEEVFHEHHKRQSPQGF